MKCVLHGFHVVIWQILIVRFQGNNCSFKEETKCVRTGMADAVRVRFLLNRFAESYYECKPNVLNEYDLTPEGSGANFETFQYYFNGDEIVMSTDPEPAYPTEYKGLTSVSTVWVSCLILLDIELSIKIATRPSTRLHYSFMVAFFQFWRTKDCGTCNTCSTQTRYWTRIYFHPRQITSWLPVTHLGKHAWKVHWCYARQENGIFGKALTKSKKISFVKTSHERF